MVNADFNVSTQPSSPASPVSSRKEKVLLCWSGGKDSAMALYEIQKGGVYEVEALLTTVTQVYDRISMHGVRCRLLDKQAEALGLPVCKILLSPQHSMEEYDAKMREMLLHFQAKGVHSVVFGDIFLEDLRRWREERLAQVEMKGIFPIWKRDTSELVHTFIRLGFKATLVCIDPKVLDRSFAGRAIDEEFLADLPLGVDPCGENGEYHSFVWGGPIFKKPVSCITGEVVERCWKDASFIYCDLLEQKGGER